MTKADDDITTLVAEAGSELTPTERRIAGVILSEPTLLAFGTVSELAKRVGTSRPSIVRFANKLGFEGYTQLQQLMRNDVSQQLTRPSERIRQSGETGSSERAALDGAMDSVFEAARAERLASFARPIARAKNVWILSGETSRAGAYAFQSGLSMVRAGVSMLEDRVLGSVLSDAGKGDVAVVFDFYRYRQVVVNASQILADAGVTIVAITDGPLSPLVEIADDWCEIAIPAIGPFDSSVPVVAIAELIVSKVATVLHKDATARIDRIEALWESTDVFL